MCPMANASRQIPNVEVVLVFPTFSTSICVSLPQNEPLHEHEHAKKGPLIPNLSLLTYTKHTAGKWLRFDFGKIIYEHNV